MIELSWIEELNTVQAELEELITSAVPDNDGEWEALEKITTAHKTLRSIDRTVLSQPKLKL